MQKKSIYTEQGQKYVVLEDKQNKYRLTSGMYVSVTTSRHTYTGTIVEIAVEGLGLKAGRSFCFAPYEAIRAIQA